MKEVKGEDLPDVVVLNIFGFLRFGDLCRVGRVCKRWYQLSRSQVLWKVVDASDVHLCNRAMEKLIGVLVPSVIHLHVHGSKSKSPLSERLVAALSDKCPRLRTLILENTYMLNMNLNTAVTLDQLPQNVETLSLRKCFFMTDQLFCMASHMDGPKITCLDFNGCWCLKDDDLPFLSWLPDLKELYLENCENITNAAVGVIAARLSQLVVLDLEGTKITTMAFFILSKSCNRLEKLFMGRTSIHDGAFLTCIAVKPLPSLKALCLCKTELTTIGFAALVDIFHDRLKWLNISGCKISSLPREETSLSGIQVIQTSNFNKQESCMHFNTRNCDW
ncbi:F-box/LRR-repeat protein 12-like [Centruroides vittatus]|uniref:F-box/LRR-repeat protein 12-like n=1 Tax=Centruroides vittatus TaxID=120091 RepID=UPI003510BE3B